MVFREQSRQAADIPSMEEDATPITLDFPPEPVIELTDDDIVDVLLEWAPVVGEA